MPVRLIPFLILLFTAPFLQAQTCTTPGQNPSTAFPVCGTNVFSQSNVPSCGVRSIPVPCNDGGGYQDKNPFWYKFTCFTAGTLVFNIVPNSSSDDYDWQLFDITGRDPNDVYTVASLFVCCNWSANTGATGTSLTAGNVTSCSGYGSSNRSKAPVLTVGHQYLLLVSNFSNSQSGYALSFSGGTAVITDPTPPRLQSVVPSCDGRNLTVKLNKKMKCNSLTSSGSDFGIRPAVPFTITTVSGAGCSTGFDTDSIMLTLQTALPSGTYQFLAKSGTDGNTLLDNCGNAIPVNDSIPLIIALNQPTPFDSIAPVGCAPQTLRVIFRKPVLCSTIATDGSDFRLATPSGATITSASGVCNNNGQATSILINLSKPLQTAGVHQLTLVQGSDGNSVYDICGEQTPANSIVSFTTKDTVSADFTYIVTLGCQVDSVALFHPGGNGITSWNWSFDGVRNSTQQNPKMYYTVFGQKAIQLVVSNGICRDTANLTVNLDNYLEAAFTGPDVLCPKDSAVFRDTSLGKIRSRLWIFGNGNTDTVRYPASQVYPPANLQTTYTVQLTVEDSIGCRDTLTKRLLVVNNCYIDVPTGFTPNGDGLNDYLYPLNAYKAMNLVFKVYNRFGQLVWQTTDWTRKWDGRVNGQLQTTGAYVWFLTYTHRETGKHIQLQGTTVLIR